MNAQVESLRIGPEKNFTYLIRCTKTGIGGLVDPSFDFEKVKAWAGPNIKFLIATHGHWDHAGGFPEMLKIYPDAKVVAGFNERSRLAALGLPLDIPLKHHDKFRIGEVELTALSTPGHTEGGTCFLFDRYILTGDTLFVGQCGRTDLPGGDDSELFKSLQFLKTLDETLVVLPGHDYGKTPRSTLGEEKTSNPTMLAKTLKEFRDLP